ncbi:hybrid sensor histidine kinase/response regulator [Burkholderia anthina]|uniref:hybrid sensor histidine kinase/response regulator n=1 Tax=Burkholderia anthina TaxID=179879 RepID=UPI0007555019|nr:hybrid sensor histidine kinase/response regulator [Burkholderia anthina]KVN53126.1 hybrid sensor histidine kinase/response regulator [Burkholderia anthina]
MIRSTRPYEGEPQTVLVVDDTPANLGVIVEALEVHGLRVAVARDGEEAIRRALLVLPDLILLDVMMPGIDGYETCRRLKGRDETADIPVIMMTSLTQTAEKVNGFRAGAVDYVIKPVQVEELAARVKTHLALREQQRLLEAGNEQLRREVEIRKQAEIALVEVLHGVRNATNAIAHDLRTPLTELRSRLEALVLTRPSPTETFAAIDEAVADTDRVISIFNALLRLAEIDGGLRRSGFVMVNVPALIAEVVEFYQPVAELKGISLNCSCPQRRTMSGDPQLIAQAVSNLIDNAIKYAPDNGRVTVAVGVSSDNKIEITVADNGPGIRDEEKRMVVQRFYRGDASRGTPGVGLGLALVAAVAKLHRGTIELHDGDPGLKATLSLAIE